VRVCLKGEKFWVHFVCLSSHSSHIVVLHKLYHCRYDTKRACAHHTHTHTLRLTHISNAHMLLTATTNTRVHTHSINTYTHTPTATSRPQIVLRPLGGVQPHPWGRDFVITYYVACVCADLTSLFRQSVVDHIDTSVTVPKVVAKK
jgi:hypothetical protein